MPAKDFIHEAVKQALIKDGWRITADPYHLSFAEVSLAVDLAAEQLLEASRENQKILVEVKSFLSRSFARDFQSALGQYQVYQALLETLGVPDVLFVAISDVVYQRFFQQTAYTMLVEKYQMRLIIVDVEQEEIVAWLR
jgi:hypothetical protein